MALLAAESVSKELDGRLVLRDASVELHPGRCLAWFGANGSGKSTLLRILATLWRPTRGVVTWGGEPVSKRLAAYRRQLGYVGHESLLYGDRSARENLRFFGGLYGVPTSSAARTRCSTRWASHGLPTSPYAHIHAG